MRIATNKSQKEFAVAGYAHVPLDFREANEWQASAMVRYFKGKFLWADFAIYTLDDVNDIAYDWMAQRPEINEEDYERILPHFKEAMSATWLWTHFGDLLNEEVWDQLWNVTFEVMDSLDIEGILNENNG